MRKKEIYNSRYALAIDDDYQMKSDASVIVFDRDSQDAIVKISFSNEQNKICMTTFGDNLQNCVTGWDRYQEFIKSVDAGYDFLAEDFTRRGM